MIKETELRIGNLIYLKHGGLGFKVHRVSSTLLFRRGNMQDVVTFSKPIPLTRDILESFGADGMGRFEIDGRMFFLRLNNVNDNGSQLGIIYSDDAKVLNYEVKYLHQLQNIIFALTGQELEVNLKPVPAVSS